MHRGRTDRFRTISLAHISGRFDHTFEVAANAVNVQSGSESGNEKTMVQHTIPNTED